MTKVTKHVSFYDTIVEIEREGKPLKVKTVSADFWPKLLDKIDGFSAHTDRIYIVGATQYYGVVARPSSPAINHLQVGRIRDLSEHLEETDLDSGTVEPLVLGPGRRVSEPTFIVPFGSKGRVAVMSPGRSTRPETIANWLTGVLGFVPKGKSIRFRPVVDENILDKLLASKGAVGVEFHMDASQELPDGDALLDAVESVRSNGPSEGTLLIGWSLGRAGGSDADKNQIKNLAATIRTGRLAKRARANMIVEDENGKVRREQHNLFEDHIVKKVSYEASPDVRLNATTMLHAISRAIVDFGKVTGV